MIIHTSGNLPVHKIPTQQPQGKKQCIRHNDKGRELTTPGGLHAVPLHTDVTCDCLWTQVVEALVHLKVEVSIGAKGQ